MVVPLWAALRWCCKSPTETKNARLDPRAVKPRKYALAGPLKSTFRGRSHRFDSMLARTYWSGRVFPGENRERALDPGFAGRVVSALLGHDISCGGPLRPTKRSVTGCSRLSRQRRRGILPRKAARRRTYGLDRRARRTCSRNSGSRVLSASQIAGVLGDGVTRNAVIGKVHRLKLSGRAKPASSAPRVRSAPRASGVRRPSSAWRVRPRALPA